MIKGSCHLTRKREMYTIFFFNFSYGYITCRPTQSENSYLGWVLK